MTGIDVLVEFLKPIGGVCVGYFLGRTGPYLDRRRRRRAYIAALEAEVNLCDKWARIYLRDGVKAPLYRLPTAALSAAFPALLADGWIENSTDVEHLESFAAFVEDINRGLDNAHRAADKNDTAGLEREANRLHLKCTHFLDTHGDGFEAYVVRARQALKRIRK
jgi:hypothetical protein